MLRRWKRSKAIRIALSAIGYCVVLAGLLVWAVQGGAPEENNVFGSLEGRFDSAIALEAGGATFFYREAEIENYLIIGVDEETIAQGGAQADMLLLLSVDRRSRTISPVMIDRDAMATVTTYGAFGNRSGERRMQISLAQAFCARGETGSENTARALSGMLCGVPIDHYAAVDIAGIALLNDAIGGVEIVPEEDMTQIDPRMQKGVSVLLDGALAGRLVRSRMDVGDGTNAARMQRQKLYMEGLLAKLFSRENGNDGLFERGMDALDGHYESDMSEKALLGALKRYKNYNWQPFVTLPGEYRIGTDGFVEFWPDGEQMRDMLIETWFR